MAAAVNKKNFNKVDTLAIYNAALAADKMTDKTLAKKYLNQCAEMNYGGAKVYSILTNLYLNEKDTATALSTIATGRKKFADDNSLVIQELNIYLSSGKDKEAFQLIDAAIQKDSTNSNLHFAKGTIADKLGKTEVAASSYKKAVQYNPNFFDAYYNLGAMYFNEGAEMTNKANNIPTNKMAEYEAAKKKYEAKFKEAQPYLEKAHEINPKDIPTMQSLRQLYARLGDLGKADEMKKAIEAVK
jgi:tetratricopeptide (TPR) repeat protein